MKNIKEKIINFIKNNIKTSGIILIVILAIVYYFLSRENKKILIGKVDTGNIEEVITVSGQVEASQESSLAFEKTGRINSVNVKVGDKVSLGQNLASLDSGNEYAATLSASAMLSQAEANLKDIQNGPSDADLKIKEDSLSSAKFNLDNANNSVVDTLRSVNANLGDILQNKLGAIFTNNSGTYKLNYNSCNQNLSSQIELERTNLDRDISSLTNTINTFSLVGNYESDNKLIDNAGYIASLASKNTSNLLDDMNNLFTSSCAIADSSLNDKRSAISTSKTLIATTITNINSQKSQIISYRNSYSAAKLSRDQLKAGATQEKIKSLSALVDSARANLVLANANYNKDFLRAPFNGVITEVNLNLGEISSPNASAIKIISDNNYQIKAKLTEIDIVKIKAGNAVKITLDTYGDSEIFDSVVSEVYPAAIDVGGVSTYYAKISFTKSDERIRSGMNATAEIVTNTKENVNYISNKFVMIKNGIAKVKVIKDLSKLDDTTTDDNDSNIELKQIEIGIRGRNGNIEVLSEVDSNMSLFPIGTEILTEDKATSTKK